jgi:2-polyprenyl-3-methyl-5-hydroxy-6-metoxy-1,4-benzoquinol methylase
LKALKRPIEALKRFNEALEINDTNAETWNNCGAVLNDLKRYDEAITKFDRAIEIQQNYAAAFSNKGKSLALLRRYDEALAMYEKALVLKPDLAEAWLGRANVFFDLRRYDEARAGYLRALSYRPDLTDAHCALAHLSLSEGHVVEALDWARRALAIKETHETKVLLASCLRSPLLHASIGDLRDLFSRALTEPWGRPAEFAFNCARFLVLNDTIRNCMARAAKTWPKLLPAEELANSASLAQFADDHLLRAQLETTPICDIALEQFATGLRFSLLTAAQSATEGIVAEPVLGLYCALARQCFINNYVFAQSVEEIEKIHALRDAVITALASGAAIPVLSLVAIAAYVPLHTLPCAASLLDRPWPDAVNGLLSQQVRAPIEEQQLRPSIPALTAIDDKVSIKVRGQYEESPYPQWVKPVPAGEPTNIDAFIRNRFPLSPFVELGNNGDAEILVAGCGTGLHSIFTAERFEAAQVLAVDLSLSSLCYAQKQTRARGVNTIHYAQADIMNLPSIGRKFDVIESVGVLHHLADPLAGWRTLLTMLKPNGIMALGFYSETARQVFAAARDLIAECGYRPVADDIRRFRQQVFDCADGTPLKNAALAVDFFSLNECRDLLFHVQEHRLTLPAIAAFIAENNLQFLGFEIDLQTCRRYAQQFPADVAMTDLAQWHQFESENPDTFRHMYQFWVQMK